MHTVHVDLGFNLRECENGDLRPLHKPKKKREEKEKANTQEKRKDQDEDQGVDKSKLDEAYENEIKKVKSPARGSSTVPTPLPGQWL